MVLDHAWGDQHNMSGRLDQQGLVGSVAQSTEGRWTTTGTLVWESTLTCQATTWPISTSCLLRKSGVVTHLSSRQEKATGLKNMEFWVKEGWTGGVEKSQGDDVEVGRHQQEQQQNGSQIDNRVAVHPRRRHQPTQCNWKNNPFWASFFKNVVKCDSHFHCPETHI